MDYVNVSTYAQRACAGTGHLLCARGSNDLTLIVTPNNCPRHECAYCPCARLGTNINIHSPPAHTNYLSSTKYCRMQLNIQYHICFPSINRWITHHLLQDEIQDKQNRISEQHRATTLSSSSAAMMMTQMCCTCTICLLEINIGERVTHLTCGHMYYHPDCLGEWII